MRQSSTVPVSLRREAAPSRRCISVSSSAKASRRVRGPHELSRRAKSRAAVLIPSLSAPDGLWAPKRRWRHTRRSARRSRAITKHRPQRMIQHQRMAFRAAGRRDQDRHVSQRLFRQHVEERLEQSAERGVERRRHRDQAVGTGNRVERLFQLRCGETGQHGVHDRSTERPQLDHRRGGRHVDGGQSRVHRGVDAAGM